MKIDFALNFKKTRKELKYLFLGATQKLNYLLNYWAEGLAKALAITNSKGQIQFGTPFGGINADGKTLVYDSNTGKVGVDYATMVSSLPPSTAINFTATDVTISSNTTLSGEIYANNFTVNSGVTLTTNGYSILCSGTFTNNGTINTGSANNSVADNVYTSGGSGGNGIYIQANEIIGGIINSNGYNGNNATTSTGATGGGGGGAILLAYGSGGYTAGTYNLSGGLGGTGGSSTDFTPTYNGGNGGATLVSGGGVVNGVGQNGSTPTAPTLSNSTILTWFQNGFVNYLTGAPAGSGGEDDGGAFYRSGNNGTSYPNSYGGSGGGGGGAGGGTGNGGNGGNGNIITYSYGTTAPIQVNGIFDAPASTNGIPIITLTYTSQYGKPIILEFDGTTTASFGSIYISINGGTIGFISNIYPDFKIKGMLPSSVQGQTYTFTLYANNTTTTAENLTLYVAYATEIGTLLSG